MTKYSVYQLLGSDNRNNRFDVVYDKNNVQIARDAFKNKYYSYVGQIIANDLDHCFEVGNIGPMENVLNPMRSLSSGDILVDWQTSEMHLIENVGFTKLN